MKYVSMFSGIEAASVAWEPLGWEPLAFAEIEPFPSAVLAHHYPGVPNMGDITAADWSQFRGKADLVVGGPPCQAFSVAGLRRSLDDDRGNLSLAYVRAVDAIDPEWVVTENVPGWLSTGDNAFGCFLAAMVGADAPLVPPRESGGRWTDAGVVTGPRRTAAWRIIDAQYCRVDGHPRAVPQRRRRVFVVAVRNPGGWRGPAALLPIGESLSRHPAPRREARKIAAAGLADGAGAGSWWDGGQVSQTLDAVLQKGQTMPEKNRFPAVLVPPVAGTVVARSSRGGGQTNSPGHNADEQLVAVSPTLRAGGNRTGGDRPPGTDVDTCDSLIPVVAGTLDGRNAAHTSGLKNEADVMVPVAFDSNLGTQGGGVYDDGSNPPMRVNSVPAIAFAHQQGGNIDLHLSHDLGLTVQRNQTQAVAFDTTQITSKGNYSNPQPGDPCHPLAAGAHPPAVAFHPTQDPISSEGVCRALGTGRSEGCATAAVAFAQNQRDEVRLMDAAGALAAEPGAKQQTYLHTGMAVRRLTPVECERLQAFPRGYTDIPWRGKPHAPDGPRYKALGNSMAVNVMAWIGRRIALVEDAAAAESEAA
jgi:DNA (cytosine-5)-methyltransferase 1